MKVKCFLPEAGQIVLTFNAYSYKDLIRGIYRHADDYKQIYKNKNFHEFFKKVWHDLQRYEAFDDRGQFTDFIFINCS